MKRATLRVSRRHQAIFDAIRDGVKTVETRAATTRFQSLQPGDTLVFKCGGEQFERQIQGVKHYNSIAAMADEVDLRSVLPGVVSLKEAESIYYKFPGYEDKIRQHGLMAFTLDKGGA